MGIFVAWWEHHLQGTGRLKLGLNLLERLLLAARALWFYVGKLIWPTKLTFSYPKWDISWTQPVQYLWLIAWAIVGWGMWRWREKLGRRVIAGIVFFVATLSPMLGFIPLYTFRYTYVADHYQYVASIGLIAIVAALGCRAAAKIRLLPIVAAIILAGYGVLTWQQCYVYGSMESLWRDILTKTPNSWMAYNNLGRELKSQGRIIEAIDCYHRALKIKPDHANAYYNLGIAYDKLGCYNDAIDAYKQTARIEPNDAEAYYRAGVACDKAGRYNEAVEAFKQTVSIRPDYAEALSNLGVAYGKLGYYAEAINACKQAVGIKPDYAAAHYNLGLAYFRAGDRNSALNECKILKALDPQEAKNLLNLIQP
jgi:tetratricopeptide (TPR) repeat protein